MKTAFDFVQYQAWTDVIHAHTAALDEQRWDDWLALHTEDVVFWLPAWINETTQTQNPLQEVSLIYIEGKSALSDRLWRLTNGDSPASVPLARTSHLVGNYRVLNCAAEEVVVDCHWHTLVYRHKRTWHYAGRCRYTLRLVDKHWLIGRRDITLTNDQVDTVLDLYHL